MKLLLVGKQQCWIDFPELWHWQLYMCLVSVSLFIIPAAIIAGCYAFIILTIWSKSSVTMTKSKIKGYLGSDNSRRVSSRGLIPRAKVKTVKITLVIVSVFILCWSPYIIFDLLQVFGYIPQTQTYIAIATFIQSLAPLNSAANPIIYCIFSTHFCKLLGNIPPFKWMDCKKKVKKSRDYTMTTTTTTMHTQSSSLSEVLTNNTTTAKRSSASIADDTRMINHIPLVSVH